MRLLTDPAVRAAIDRPKLKFLVDLRFHQLAVATAGYDDESSPDEDDGCASDLLEAYLVEPGDGFAEIQVVSCLDLQSGILSGSRWGDAGFMPCLDLLEHQAECFELVAVRGEGAISLFIPDESEMDAAVLAFCREFAEEGLPLDEESQLLG